MTEDKKFGLVSDELLKIADEYDRTDAPVFKVWAGGYLDMDALRAGKFDEEVLLGTAQSMLNDTGNFFAEPGVVGSLRSIFNKAVEDKETYLKFALSKQKIRLQNMIGQLKPEYIEKRRKEFDRYLEKAKAELAALDTEKQGNEMSDVMFFRIRKFLLKEKGLKSYADHPEYWPELALKRPDILLAFENIKEQVIDEYIVKWRKIESKAEDISTQFDIFEIQVETLEQLGEVLAKTDRRLAELGVVPVQKTSQAEPEEVAPISSERPVVPKDRITTKKKAKVRDGVSDVQEVKKENADVGIQDIERLQIMIQIAYSKRNKIRILASESSARFEDPWCDLFNMLGFRGEIEFVFYDDLRRPADFGSPLVVPRKMNTHKALWKSENFENLVVTEFSSPKLLIAKLEMKQKLLINL